MTYNQALKRALKAEIPPGWAYSVRVTDREAEIVIRSAPVDLLALDARLSGAERGKPYAQAVPLAYEGATCEAGRVICRLLEVAHQANEVRFDSRGDRIGSWRAVSVWIGHWRVPFCVLPVDNSAAPAMACGLQPGLQTY